MFYHNFYKVDPFKPKSVEFDVWSQQEVKKLSVAKITSFIPFDGLGYPVAGGLYDARLGPLQFKSDPCATCGNFLTKCSGHYGHIELPLTVFNPLFMAIIANILKSSCMKCHKFLVSDAEKNVYTAQLRLIDAGYLIEAHQLDSYLEENMYKSTSVIREEMVKFCNDVISSPSSSILCKYADEKWRYYVGKLLRQGALSKMCVHCKKKVVKVKYHRDRLFTQGSEKERKNTYLMPMAVRDHLRLMWQKEKDLLEILFKVLARSNEPHPTDLFFTDCVLVTPSNTRPVNVINEKPMEHPKNSMYRLILQDCQQIRSIMQVMNDVKSAETLSKEIQDVVNACRGDTVNEKLHNAWYSLQISVNSLLDANALKALINTSVGMSKVGLKQLIEKKQGILRKNMMGKRVDYFARSVVTPDPMLNINEIGVPEAFAKKLTFPVPVTPWNVTQLRKMVLNGPQQYPGANIVEDDGAVVWISGTNKEGRESLAKTLLTPKLNSSGPKVVHRHLLDGDMLLMNRQPSLHKPSIMAHKARVLKAEKTFRLHYANCKAYNADFDGDEVNAHFPQGELARAEASELVNAAYQYLVPRDGTPLSGLIQDHVIAGFRLSIRDKFFDRSQYNQLVFQAIGFLVDDIRTLPPAILKPKRLWSGKQVISTIIINLTPPNNVPLNMNSKSKLAYGAWPTVGGECAYMSADDRKYMSEMNVMVRQGELLCGVLDKNHVGSTHYGLVHSFYELYGGQYSANLLSAFSKLFTYYQQKDGFTLGVLDILVRRRADKKRSKIAARSRVAGMEAAKRALDIPAEQEVDETELQRLLEAAYKKNTNFRGLIDREYKTMLDQFTNDINKVCLPVGLLQPFPENNLQLMVQSGAKGSTVNTMQISCLLGQIELEGKRPPLMISGKSLPSFRAYDPSPIAGGFIVSRFMTGIQPQEFFFHCMAGREGLIDTAVKTSRSGYLQRCLVKHLEGLVVNYDLTVRDSDNSVIQFQYGEDGLDILKSQLLKLEQMKFFSENIDAFIEKKQMKYLKRGSDTNEMKERKWQIARLKREQGSRWIRGARDGAFLRFCREARGALPSVKAPNVIPGRTKAAADLCHVWTTVIDEDTKEMYEQSLPKPPDPVVAEYKPDIHFGAVSEVVESMIDDYIEHNEGKLPFKKSKFKDVVYWKTFKSLCQPGEAVGVLAAQSVGEPSTQMTLNTFHFAGRGEMNVTLGIPRLREILMVASKRIKTPTMEIPFKTDVPNLEKKAEFLRKSLSRVVLKDVLEKIVVNEKLRLKNKHMRVYELNLHYLPRRGYSSMTNLKSQHILSYVQKEFVAKLYAMLKKNTKSCYTGDLIFGKSMKKLGEPNKNDDGDERDEPNHVVDHDDSDEDSDAGGDGDASETKRRDRKSDAMEYDDENEDEDDVLIDDNGSPKEKTLSEADSDDEDVADADQTIPDKSIQESDDESDDSDKDDTTTDLKGIFNESTSASQKKGVHVIEDYCVKSVTHDPVNKSWTKIVIWVSCAYKRIDLSDVLPNLLENAVIHEVPGIKRAITYTNTEGLLTLKTEGSYGIEEFFKHDCLLDLNKLYSNDIHAIARTYGIEAANRVIYKEVQEVFKVYGITVDPRHLLLIADYMTFDGTFQPLNRSGMDNCPSPLQQMTFESTLKYLKNATIRKLKDNLKSPSSSLIVGQESKIGSGLMSLYCK